MAGLTDMSVLELNCMFTKWGCPPSDLHLTAVRNGCRVLFSYMHAIMGDDPLPERVHSSVSKAVDTVARLSAADGPDCSVTNFPEARSRRCRSVDNRPICIGILGIHL